MPVDTSSYGEAAGASHSLADYQQQYQGIAQNALNLQRSRQQLDAYTQDQAEKASVRNYLQPRDGVAPDLSTAQGYNGLIGAGPTIGPGIYKTYQEGLTSAALAKKDLGSAAESNQKVADQAFAHYQNALGTVQTPEEAARFITASYHDPVIGPELQKHGTLEEGLGLLSKLSATPEGFQQWLAHASVGLEKMAAAEKIQQIDTGGATRTQVYQPYTGQVSTVATMPKTATPGEVLSNGIASARLTEERRHNTATEGLEATKTANAGAAGVKMTEDQGKATGWLVQAENAFGNMQKATKADPSAARPGFNDALGALPGMSGIANSMRGAERQKFMQGASSLSEALLRAATGAGVNKDEAAQKIQELTPVFGEDPSTTEQKMAAIPLYIESLKVRAGPGAPKAATVLASKPQAGAPAANGWKVEEVK